jgi:pimeloyl-ACP methyl ester carboxylesterase
MQSSSYDPPAAADGVRSHSVEAGGLVHHVLEWPAEAPVATALLLHGYMDAAATWDLVAPSLASRGLRVVAPDLRGFGDAPRVGAGGYYHFPDYLLDVADVADAFVPEGAPLLVVGHSMGGTIATMYTGSFPERVSRLAILEGSGPPASPPSTAPDRARRWVDEVRIARARGSRRMPSREDAQRRLFLNHPTVPHDVLRKRLDDLARPLPDGEGMVWRSDPLHGTRSPTPFIAEAWMAFAGRAKCPVLSVSGGPKGWHPPDEETRLGAFPTLERAEIPDAGHMMHWTRPDELSRILGEFLLRGR